MGRAPCCDKANVKKGPWSPEEDTKLKEYMEKYGTGGNWIALPQKAGLKRCGKSCRLRWLNYLRPNIKHGEFSEEEDTVICNLYATIGSRWSIIAAQLPGRTDNDIKNYWNTKLKKKLMGMASNGTGNYMIKNPSFTPHPQGSDDYNKFNKLTHQQQYQFQFQATSSTTSSCSLIRPSSSSSSSPFNYYYNTSVPTTITSPTSTISTLSFSGGFELGQSLSTSSASRTLIQQEQEDGFINFNPPAAPMQQQQQQQQQNHNIINSYNLVFGGAPEASSSSSDDGSCNDNNNHNRINNSHGKYVDKNGVELLGNGINFQGYSCSYDLYNNGLIKEEEEENHQANEAEKSQNSTISFGHWGDATQLMDYGLEEINQLISSTTTTTTISNIESNDGLLACNNDNDFYFDENKTGDGHGGVILYY